MLGDKVIVTSTTGPGKVEVVTVEAKSAGGEVSVVEPSAVGYGPVVDAWQVLEYSRKRKAVKRRLIVAPSAMLTIDEVPRR